MAYTPSTTNHDTIRQIADGEALNAANINKGTQDTADNVAYNSLKIRQAFAEAIGSIVGAAAVDGLALGLNGGQIAVTHGGRLIYNHMYADFGIQNLGALVAAPYVIYARWLNANTFNYTPSLHYASSVPSDTTSTYYLHVANVSATGVVTWVISQSSESDYIAELRAKMHVQNTDTHTTAPAFYVGGDSTSGLRVLTEPSLALTPPLALRIKSISGNIPILPDSSMTGLLTGEIPPTQTVNVLLGWDYDYITGTAGNGSFTIDNAGLSFSNNALAGKYLYIFTANTGVVNVNLLITSNTGLNLTVTNIDGSPWDGTGIIVTTIPAWIHENVDYYEIVATPVVSGNPTTSQRIEITSSDRFNVNQPLLLEKSMQLQTGIKCRFRIRACTKGSGSDWTEMLTSGTLDGQYPTVIKVPDIANDGQLGAVPTRFGFRVTIQGWTTAEQFQIVYTTDNSGASFTNPAHHAFITSSNTVDIPTAISANYNIKARPLIGGQQVQAPLSASVVSGAGGIEPQDYVFFSGYFWHRTFSGTATFSGDASKGTVTFSNMKYPAGDTGSSLTRLPQDITGQVITDSAGQDYLITQVTGDLTAKYQGSRTSLSPTNGSCTIGVSKRARRLARTNEATVNFEIVRFDVDCDILESANDTTVGALVRVYQESKEVNADSIIISANDTPFTTDADVQVLSTYGSRNVIIDLFDPDDVMNETAFQGRVTVYARNTSIIRQEELNTTS